MTDRTKIISVLFLTLIVYLIAFRVKAQSVRVFWFTPGQPVCAPLMANLEFDILNGTAPQTIVFNDHSFGSFTTNYSLNYGDGNTTNFPTSFGTTPHLYSTAGVFVTTLIVYNACGNTSTDAWSHTISPTNGSFIAVPAGFGLGNVCVGTTTNSIFMLTNLTGSAINNGTITINHGTGFSVSGGSNFTLAGNQSSNVTISLTPASAISYSGQVLFLTSNGGSQTGIVTATGLALASSLFSSDKTSGVAPLVVTFTNSSVGATNYDWTFSDGSTSLGNTGVVVAHTFNNCNTNPTTLIAYGICGNSTSSYSIKLSCTNELAAQIFMGSLGGASNFFQTTSGSTGISPTDFTIEFWFKQSINTVAGELFQQGPLLDPGQQIDIRAAPNHIDLVHLGGAGADWGGTNTFLTNAWNHFAISVSGGTNAQIFLNGVKDYPTVIYNYTWNPANTYWFIGGNTLQSGLSDFMAIDNLIIWNSAKYSSLSNFVPICRPTNETGMVNRYNFNDSDQTDAADAVGGRTLFIKPGGPARTIGNCPAP